MVQAVMTSITTVSATDSVIRPAFAYNSDFQRLFEGSDGQKTPKATALRDGDIAEGSHGLDQDHADDATGILSFELWANPSCSVVKCADQTKPRLLYPMVATDGQDEAPIAAASLAPCAASAYPQGAVPVEKPDFADGPVRPARPLVTVPDRSMDVSDISKNQTYDHDQVQYFKAQPPISTFLKEQVQYPEVKTEYAEVAGKIPKDGVISTQAPEITATFQASGMAPAGGQVNDLEENPKKWPSAEKDESDLPQPTVAKPSVSAPQSVILSGGLDPLRMIGENGGLDGQVNITSDLAFAAVADRSAGPSGAMTAPFGADAARQTAQQMVVGIIAQPDKATEITLNPVELGRVRMQLTAHDGVLTLQIIVERPDTADLLRRHIDILAQEFRAIGFQDLSFLFSGEGRRKPSPALPTTTTDSQSIATAVPDVPAASSRAAIGVLDLRL